MSSGVFSNIMTNISEKPQWNFPHLLYGFQVSPASFILSVVFMSFVC